MNKINWIFFDLDGTLVNNMSSMYKAYNDFLKDYNLKGSKKEFETLNGPTIQQIVTILKNKYNIKENKERLFRNYRQKVRLAYKTIRPNKNTTKLLKKLHNNYRLALVTSSPKHLANIILKNCKWKRYFRYYTYGDEVRRSKPHTDIYKLCLKKTKARKDETLVIEDSKNGYQSARKTGLNCIILSKKQKLSSIPSLLNYYER